MPYMRNHILSGSNLKVSVLQSVTCNGSRFSFERITPCVPNKLSQPANVFLPRIVGPKEGGRSAHRNARFARNEVSTSSRAFGSGCEGWMKTRPWAVHPSGVAQWLKRWLKRWGALSALSETR